jgi:hypothetical protein
MQQQTLAAPWMMYATPAARTGAWGDYVRGLSLVVWLLAIILSFWWQSAWRDVYAIRESGFDKNAQMFGAGLALAAHLTLGLAIVSNTVIQFFNSVRGRCLGGFCLLMLALSPFSIAPIRSVSYSLATLGAFLVLSLAWHIDPARFRRVMLIAGVVLLCYLYALLLRHGISRTSIGGTNRNRIGQAALTAVICLFLSQSKIKWIGFAVGLALALLVNSRGTLASFCVFAAVYYVLRHGMGRSVLVGLLAVVGITIALVLPRVGRNASDVLINDIARLHDKGRGLGSGFAGRWETWEQGMKVFAKSPAIGHGFRSRIGGGTGDEYFAHSGYVNLLADTGLIGAALVIGTLGYEFFKRLGITTRLRGELAHPWPQPEQLQTLELNSVICAFLIIQGALWLIEPLYLNLGATLSVLFLFLVMAPYQFGKSAAPYAYVPVRHSG